MESLQNQKDKDIKVQNVNFYPFEGRRIVKVIPTIPSQTEIWLACIIGDDEANLSYNLSLSIELDGFLNELALYKSLHDLLEEHEMLRSSFTSDGKYICIYNGSEIDYKVNDIMHLSAEEKNEFVYQLNKSDSKTLFDLENGPLFRAYLTKISHEKTILKLTAHHIICDGWSFGVILNDLSALYSAHVTKSEPRLKNSFSFSTYAKEIIMHSKTVEYRNIEAFWLNQFKQVPIVNLPTDRDRPVKRTYNSRNSQFPIAKEIIEAIQRIGIGCDASFVTTLITTLEIYLSVKTKEEDIVIGLPAAGQPASGNLGLVGHCVNLLPIKSKVQDDLSFEDYLSLRNLEIVTCYEYQRITFGSLLQKLKIARDTSRVPLVPFVFNVDIGLDADVSFKDLNHRVSFDPRSYENFEIFLNIKKQNGEFIFDWSYNALLFEQSTIEQMMSEYTSILSAIVAKPKSQIKTLKTAVQYSDINTQTTMLNNALKKWSLEDPHKVAVKDGNIYLTYEELNRQANQFSNYLIHHGVKKGDIVALSVDRCAMLVIALIGIMKTGAAYLPIDPQLPKDRITSMFKDSNTQYLIVNNGNLDQYPQLKKISIEHFQENKPNICADEPQISILGSDLAYVLYTSGSTGKPKGVLIEHHSLTNLLESASKTLQIKPSDRWLAISTISFDIAANEIYLPLITGASMYLADEKITKDGNKLLDLLAREEISILQATPITWRILLEAGWSENLQLKVICTGESFPKDLMSKLLMRGSEVWNGYGPTETTIWSSLKRLTESDEIITIGKPIDNMRMYILDESLNHLPVGNIGEIFISGAGIARGYLNRDDLTRDRFVDDITTERNSKMYKTGDLGYLMDNGEIVCLGRKDNQVKIRGYRIELEEIEFQLKQQSDIQDAAVIAYGNLQHEQKLAVFLKLHDDNSSAYDQMNNGVYTINSERISKWKKNLKMSLPQYMIPNIYFGLHIFPFTNNGKLDRNRLDIIANSIETRVSNKKTDINYSVQNCIYDIWAEILNVANPDVNDNFFEMGGHSLTAVKLTTRIRKTLGIRVPVSLLFENPTIDMFSKQVALIVKN